VKIATAQTNLFLVARCSTPPRLAIWTRQLAGLVAASGLPLERALTVLTDETGDDKQRNLVAEPAGRGQQWLHFGRAGAAPDEVFPTIYVA
jgi:general secretion pathway protein F